MIGYIVKWLLFILAILSPIYPVNASILRDSLSCLAYNIYFEARDQSKKGQNAVAFVVINRVKSSKFPDTICKVIKQKHQFSWYREETSAKIHNRSALVTAFKLAKHILYGKHKDPTNGALYYHNLTVKPYWANKVKFITKIGNHLFYK